MPSVKQRFLTKKNLPVTCGTELLPSTNLVLPFVHTNIGEYVDVKKFLI